MGGESAANLSREYGISQAAISVRVSKVSKLVTEAAHKLADAQTTIAALPVAQQYAAVNLADKLRSISNSIASAADLGAKTAHRLHSLANSEVNKVDDADPLNPESMEALKGVSVLTKLANDSSHIALNLLNANKGNGVMTGDETPLATLDVTRLSSAARRELLEARGDTH